MPAPSFRQRSSSWRFSPELRDYIGARKGDNVTAALIGYADRISVCAGEKIAFKISSTGPEPYRATLVRIVRGDPNPDGPPPKFEDLSQLFDGDFASREQRAWPGSYAVIDGAATVELPASLSVEALIWPTLPADSDQAVISRREPESGVGFSLVQTANGMALETGGTRIAVGKALRARTWYRVWASADPVSGILRVGQQPLKRAFAVDDEGEAVLTVPTALALDTSRPILIGAEQAKDRPAYRCFNGKIEAPSVAGVAVWDFSRRVETMEIEDVGPNGLHGRLVNLPTRAMKGAGRHPGTHRRHFRVGVRGPRSCHGPGGPRCRHGRGLFRGQPPDGVAVGLPADGRGGGRGRRHAAHPGLRPGGHPGRPAAAAAGPSPQRMNCGNSRFGHNLPVP
jgi:hypothetical protein